MSKNERNLSKRKKQMEEARDKKQQMKKKSNETNPTVCFLADNIFHIRINSDPLVNHSVLVRCLYRKRKNAQQILIFPNFLSSTYAKIYYSSGSATQYFTIHPVPQPNILRFIRFRNPIFYYSSGSATQYFTIHPVPQPNILRFIRFRIPIFYDSSGSATQYFTHSSQLNPVSVGCVCPALSY